MEDLFDRFWGDVGGGLSVSAPPVDLSETDSDVQVRMDVPGFDPEKIDVQISGNQLTVRGERDEEKEEKGERFYRVERRGGGFSRTLTLPAAVDEEKVDANYRDGVLRIKMPKSEQAKTKRVEVKGS